MAHKKISDHNCTATTRLLTKILIYLREVEYVHKTNIQKVVSSDRRRVDDALLWLVNHKLIKKKKGEQKFKRHQSVNYYTLNEDYWKLYNEI